MDKQTEEQREQMQKYGIQQREKMQYIYQGYVYDRFQDALNYARIDTEREARRVQGQL